MARIKGRHSGVVSDAGSGADPRQILCKSKTNKTTFLKVETRIVRLNRLGTQGYPLIPQAETPRQADPSTAETPRQSISSNLPNKKEYPFTINPFRSYVKTDRNNVIFGRRSCPSGPPGLRPRDKPRLRQAASRDSDSRDSVKPQAETPTAETKYTLSSILPNKKEYPFTFTSFRSYVKTDRNNVFFGRRSCPSGPLGSAQDIL